MTENIGYAIANLLDNPELLKIVTGVRPIVNLDPNATLPYITYTIVDFQPLQGMNIVSGAYTGTIRFYIDADSENNVYVIANYLKTLLPLQPVENAEYRIMVGDSENEEEIAPVLDEATRDLIAWEKIVDFSFQAIKK